jgi:hypothetical protein
LRAKDKLRLLPAVGPGQNNAFDNHVNEWSKHYNDEMREVRAKWGPSISRDLAIMHAAEIVTFDMSQRILQLERQVSRLRELEARIEAIENISVKDLK